MIFVTVGTQLPFPRLIDAMDRFAAELEETVIAQTGPGDGDWPHLERHANLTPETFTKAFCDARVVIAHAGIGTILSAKRFGKPLIILPRRHSLDEHRNDHQLATSRQVQHLPGIHIAWEVEDILPLLTGPPLDPATADQSQSHAALITRLRDFIDP